MSRVKRALRSAARAVAVAWAQWQLEQARRLFMEEPNVWTAIQVSQAKYQLSVARNGPPEIPSAFHRA